MNPQGFVAAISGARAGKQADPDAIVIHSGPVSSGPRSPAGNEPGYADSDPAHGNVHFAYRAAHDGRVEVRVHDIVGRLLARSVRAYQLAGEQLGVWGGRFETAERARVGACFLSATIDGQPIGMKKLLLR